MVDGDVGVGWGVAYLPTWVLPKQLVRGFAHLGITVMRVPHEPKAILCTCLRAYTDQQNAGAVLVASASDKCGTVATPHIVA